MARNAHTPEALELIASQLAEGVATLTATVKAMREGGLPSALIHGTTSQNRYIPAILDWIEKAAADTKSQLRAHAAGIQSDVERRKAYSETQKQAAAKKPWRKKSVKKAE